MMLAEQLLLVAWDPEKGRPPLGKKDALKTGLCGALVSELTLRKAVTVVEARAVVVDSSPLGDDLLDDVLRVLAEDGTRGRTLKRQLRAVRRATGDLTGRIARRLVDAGVFRRADRRVAGIFPTTRYPVAALDAPGRLRDEVRAWLGDAPGAAPDPRTAALVALLRACGLLGSVTHGLRDRRHASARARAAMKDDPAARAVKAIVDEVYAVSAGVVVVLFGV